MSGVTSTSARISAAWASIRCERWSPPRGRGKTSPVRRHWATHLIAVDAATDRVRVEKVRLQKRHLKPGRKGARQGGIIEQEGFVHASNVMLVNGEGQPSRVRIEDRDGRKVRVFKSNGEVVDV